MSASKTKNKIIPMALDANFFFERALRHLHRNNHSKALKYFRKTVDKEPNNPVHYCNIAGLLAEMGRFKESNELLLFVVEKLDPSFTECYYYLANNYAYLEDIESSYKYIHRYLDAAPHGEFADEAEEMLSYISIEIDEINEYENEEQKDLFVAHYKAKSLLEEGKFYEAAKKLKRMVEEHPDFLAARNNLALAYFYLGNHFQAIEQTREVLNQEKTNIHAMCNLAIFYKHLNNEKELTYIINALKKILPFQREHRYKLATTFAILGEHDMAYKYLKQIIHYNGDFDAALLHYTAVAAFNTKRVGEARGLWEKIVKLDSDSQIASFYLEIISQLEDDNLLLPNFSYQYQMPFEEQINFLQHKEKSSYDAFIFSSFLWGLKNGDENVKEKILLGLALLQKDKAEPILRDFLMEEQHAYELKKKAVITLEQMDAKPPYKLLINGKLVEMDRQSPDFSSWKNNWIEVLALIDEKMGVKYNIIELYDAKTLWYEFISQTYPDTPLIRKSAGWVAAIEYIVAKMHQKPITMTGLANKYQVGEKTIAKHIEQFDDLMQVKKKILNTYLLSH